MLFKNKFFQQLIFIFINYFISYYFLFRSFIINFVLLQISILFLLISKVKKYNFMKYKYNRFCLYFLHFILLDKFMMHFT